MEMGIDDQLRCWRGHRGGIASLGMPTMQAGDATRFADEHSTSSITGLWKLEGSTERTKEKVTRRHELDRVPSKTSRYPFNRARCAQGRLDLQLRGRMCGAVFEPLTASD
jgi:hypothetical protein